MHVMLNVLRNVFFGVLKILSDNGSSSSLQGDLAHDNFSFSGDFRLLSINGGASSDDVSFSLLESTPSALPIFLGERLIAH